MENATDTPLHNSRIMVVDDTRVNISIISILLKKKGYQVEGISSGQVAIERCKESPPDLILLDVEMPEMNGFEVCRRLKADSKTQNIPIIFLTAKHETESIVEGFNSGGSDYVHKPYRSEELLARVALQFKLKRAQDKLEKQNHELQEALYHIKNLRGQMVTMCAWTKRIKEDGEWISLEKFLENHLSLKISHGMSEDALREFEKEIPPHSPLPPSDN